MLSEIQGKLVATHGVCMDFATVVSRIVKAAEEAHRIEDEGKAPTDLRGWKESKSRLAAGDRVRAVMHLLRRAGRRADDACIVDAGCGMGHDAFILAFLGARRVVGVDANGQQVDFVNALARRCEIDGRCVALRGTAGDLPLGDECADLVLCNEVLSHFLDSDASLAEAKRILRPGGCLIAADGNNAMSPLVCRQRRQEWHVFETGEGLPAGRLGYRDRRRHLIAEQFPGMDEATLDLLADGTFGLAGDLIAAICRAYLSGRHDTGLQRYRRGVCPVDPTDGGYAERLLDPRELARRLLGLGFRSARFWARCGNRTPYWLLNGVFARLTPLTIRVAPAFVLTAYR